MTRSQRSIFLEKLTDSLPYLAYRPNTPEPLRQFEVQLPELESQMETEKAPPAGGARFIQVLAAARREF